MLSGLSEHVLALGVFRDCGGKLRSRSCHRKWRVQQRHFAFVVYFGVPMSLHIFRGLEGRVGVHCRGGELIAFKNCATKILDALSREILGIVWGRRGLR